MVKKRCIILVPTNYNDGRSVPEPVIAGILRDIEELCDGCTVDGTVSGSYRMPDGHFARDELIKVWAAVQPERVGELETLARAIARTVKQDSVYFEIMESEVKFLRPGPESGE